MEQRGGTQETIRPVVPATSAVRPAVSRGAGRVVRATRTGYRWLRPRPTGVTIGVLFFCTSLTPSLLPRPWLAQGLISGVALAIGYGIGSVAGRAGLLARRIPAVDRTLEAAGRRRRFRPTGRVMAGTLLALVLAAVYLGSGWQHDLSVLMGRPAPPRATYLRVPVIALALLAGAVALVRAVRDAGRFIVRHLQRRIPPGPLQVLGITTALVVSTIIAEEIALGGFFTISGRVSSRINDTLITSQPPPSSPARSAGPGSLVSWHSLGLEGRSFVSGGPTRAQLADFSAAAALEPASGVREPIRVYVGLKTTPDPRAAAALAVAELERTGAFSRAVLCVVTTTGTGWVDPYLAAALEYLYRGDSAMVGVQYSYLPSWISFLSERDRVARYGPELFDQVYARWSRLPAGRRPRLVVFAESLGSLGSEAGFSSLDDVRARTQGVLWSGPTHTNPLWRQFEAGRDPGSPETLPIYDGGRTVRFVSRPADLDRPATGWGHPRVVYLQNPSDPVTWWTPTLLWRRPDWLSEPRGHDVLPAMRWYPVVTFVQVTADLALAYGAPRGHGHQFRTAAAAAWAAVASPPGWTPAATRLLTERLDVEEAGTDLPDRIRAGRR
jgi:uncharacterized membrane protein